MGRRISWFVTDSKLKLSLSFGALPIPAMLDERKRGVRLGQRIVNLQRLGRGLLGFWERFFRLVDPVGNEHVVAVGEPGVSRSIVLICLDRFPKILDALKETIFSSFVPIVAALQIQTERLNLLLLFDAQLEPQIFEDVARNILLHKKNVRHSAIVMLTPHLRDVSCVDQLSLYAQVVASPMNSSGEHRADVQLSRDLARIRRLALVV